MEGGVSGRTSLKIERKGNSEMTLLSAYITLDENSMVREYGSEHSSGAGIPRPIGCGCGRKLMVAAVQLARMSCTQRQTSGGAERDEAHVGGMRIP